MLISTGLWAGKEMPASLGLMVEAIFGIMGFQRLLHLGALSVQLSKSSLVCK